MVRWLKDATAKIPPLTSLLCCHLLPLTLKCQSQSQCYANTNTNTNTHTTYTYRYQYVKHWLAQMEILEHDIKYLKNVQVVMFECVRCLSESIYPPLSLSLSRSRARVCVLPQHVHTNAGPFAGECSVVLVLHRFASLTQTLCFFARVHYYENALLPRYFTANGYGPTNYKRLMNAIDLPAELNISTSLRKERYPLTKMIEIDEQRKKMKKLREEEPWRFKEKKPRRQLVWTDDEEGGEWEEGVQLEDVNERGSTMQNGMGAAFEEDGMRRNDVAEERGRRRHRHGRKLQGYIGKAVGAETMDLELHTERWMSWTEAWDERIPVRNHYLIS